MWVCVLIVFHPICAIILVSKEFTVRLPITADLQPSTGGVAETAVGNNVQGISFCSSTLNHHTLVTHKRL